MKIKLRLIACAILLIVSVNANATMTPVSKVKRTPNFNGDISLLISGPEVFAPVIITDYRLKLYASSLEVDTFMDAVALPAEIHGLIVNTIDKICPDQQSDSFTISLEVTPERAALVIFGLQNN